MLGRGFGLEDELALMMLWRVDGGACFFARRGPETAPDDRV